MEVISVDDKIESIENVEQNAQKMLSRKGGVEIGKYQAEFRNTGKPKKLLRYSIRRVPNAPSHRV
jgi:hypothetical protein